MEFVEAALNARQHLGTVKSRAVKIFRNHSEWSKNQTAQGISDGSPKVPNSHLVIWDFDFYYDENSGGVSLIKKDCENSRSFLC